MRAIAIVLLASLLAACGGGNALAPVVSQRDAADAGQTHRGSVRVKMRIVIRAVPRSGHFAHRIMRDGRRNPFYTASSTQGIDVQVRQGTSGVLAEAQTDISAYGGNCQNNTSDNSRTCNFALPVPPGNDTFYTLRPMRRDAATRWWIPEAQTSSDTRCMPLPLLAPEPPSTFRRSP